MTEQQYLEAILAKYKVSEYDMQLVQKHAEEVATYLRSLGGTYIRGVYYSGSLARNTAVSINFDIDICVTFENNAFNDLSTMYQWTYEKLRNKYINVKQQRVSIGIPQKNIDVVPSRLIVNSNDVNLWDFKQQTWKQTNIHTHTEYIKSNGDIDIIKLFKIWKKQHQIDIKSFGLEILTVNALKNYTGDNLLGPKMRHIWNYIKNHDLIIMRLIDPANSNNDIMDSIDYNEKTKLKKLSEKALSERYWKDIIQ